MPQLRSNLLARPHCEVVNNTTFTVPNNFSWITFTNTGGANATIDFGNGQVYTLGQFATEGSLTLPYIGNSYSEIIVNATGTVVKVVWLP